MGVSPSSKKGRYLNRPEAPGTTTLVLGLVIGQDDWLTLI